MKRLAMNAYPLPESAKGRMVFRRDTLYALAEEKKSVILNGVRHPAAWVLNMNYNIVAREMDAGRLFLYIPKSEQPKPTP